MITLLKKEFSLSLHPTSFFYPLFAAFVFIPDYPYEVPFFFCTLSVFLTCITGRENGDLTFTSLLPVAKKDVAFARILSTVIMQFITLLLLNLFVVIKCAVPALSTPNVSGLDANIALNGIGLLIFGVFNIVFFIPYFTHPTKIGIPFLISSILTFVIIGSSVTLATAVPAYQTYIDTPDHSYVGYKLIVVAVGLIVYIVLTLLAVKISCKRFEKVNL